MQRLELSTSPAEVCIERWPFLQRLAFRFFVVYFGLFCILEQPIAMFLPMLNDYPYTFWPFRQIIFWTGAHVFHTTLPLVYMGSGSGDKVYDWVFIFLLLVASVAGTALWSILDRKRDNYAKAYAWFRLFIRYMLAGQLLVYGFAKLIPEQMPYPSLARLVEPFGNLSPMGVLWASIGSSQAYEIFAGSMETLAGLLLIFPRTTMFGALIAVADMTQVFTLNMTYDVPVKILSFQLLLFALFLLAPDALRVVNFLVLNRPVPSANLFPLFVSPRANRIALVVQGLLGAYLVVLFAYSGWTGWFRYGGAAPKSALYGIWNVRTMTVDRKQSALAVTDPTAWRRVIFGRPGFVQFQRMDDSFQVFGTVFDLKKHIISLAKLDDKKWRATLHFHLVDAHRLTIDGNVDKHEIHLGLASMDPKSFVLTSRGFNWVQDYPFNR